MNIDMDYRTFCELYFLEAEEVADITIDKHVSEHGPIDPKIDVDLVKDLGVSYALDKVFETYDVDNKNKASIKTFLSVVVRNTVLNELSKARTEAKKKRRTDDPATDLYKENSVKYDYRSGEDYYGLLDTLKIKGKFEKKEELIAAMHSCMAKMDPVDVAIIKIWSNYPRFEYTAAALDELGWEDTPRTRNMVQVRCTRAIGSLGMRMEKYREDFLNVFSTPEKMPEEKTIGGPRPKTHSDVDYNFIRRRRRAARKSITSGIDYSDLAASLADML